MKVLCLVILGLVYFQGALAARRRCRIGSAAPQVCACDLLSNADNNCNTAIVETEFLPAVAREEFASRVPGKRYRKSRQLFDTYCRDACLNHLRIALLQPNDVFNQREKDTESTFLQAAGWDALCNRLYNPSGEIADGSGRHMDLDSTLHFWLGVTKRGCHADPANPVASDYKLYYLGSMGCDCYDFDQLNLQVCYSAATLGAYAAGAGAVGTAVDGITPYVVP